MVVKDPRNPITKKKQIDEDLLALLKKKFPEKKEFFINCDFLKFDPKEIFGLGRFRLVGNIPYNISSPILGWCENHYEQIVDMHFMLQKEFALRCLGTEKTSSYGRLSVICNYLYEVEILKDIEREYFEPKPKVNSTLIKITPHDRHKMFHKKYALFQKVLSICFASPRKKILSALKKIDLASEKFDFDINKRAEELEINNFFEILNLYESKL